MPEKNGKNPETGEASNEDIVTTRILRVPPARVWTAFADPIQLARWWGPQGFTNTIPGFDLRVGGIWRLVMHGPDGKDYASDKRFLEVDAPRRVVFEHLETTHGFRLAMDFVAVGDGTRLTWTMRFASAAEGARVRPLVVAANEQNFDRLEAHLAATPFPS